MARVTIEDCLKTTGGHFDVAKLASRRAHQLEMGAEALIERSNDKSTVVALREIAENLVDEKLLEAGQDDGLMEIEIAGITQYEETPADAGAAESAKSASKPDVPAAKKEPVEPASETQSNESQDVTAATADSATAEKAEATESVESAESTEKPMSLGDQIEDEDVGAAVADVEAHSDFHEDSPEAEQTLAVEVSDTASEEEPQILEVPGTDQEQDASLEASLDADNAFDADDASDDASDFNKTD